MSKINPKRAFSKEIIESFTDIGRRNVPHSDGEHTPVNFRIRADGSLEKRCGWRVYDSFAEGNVRGIWQGVLNGTNQSFAVCGNTVLRLEDTRRTVVSSLATQTGQVNFFVYCGALYLLDGLTLRIWDERTLTFRTAEGYAPLYGSGWDPVKLGSVNEDINLFSNRLRVLYRASQPATEFMLPFYAKSIDAVKVNGYSTTDYSFPATLDRVILTQPQSYVEIAFTIYLENESTADLYRATQAHPTHLGSAERLFLYGTPRGHYLYVSAAVSDIRYAASRACYPNSDRLYFRADDVMIIGDSDSPITTLCRDNDRLLAFHSSGAAVIEFPLDQPLNFYAVSTIPGCSVPNMDVSVGGNRYVLNSSGLFRLVHDSGSPDQIMSIPLGLPIPLNDPSKLAHLHVAYHPIHDEIWICDPFGTDGFVHIYQPSSRQFYRFDNVCASRMVTVDGLFGFFAGNEICVFEEHLTTDGGKAFSAVVETGWLHFGSPEFKKRSLRVSLLAFDADGIVLTLDSEHRQCEVNYTDNAFSKHFLDVRVPLGRFRLLRATLRDDGTLRPRISRLALYANL